MIKAIFFDFFGVINIDGGLNHEIAEFIRINNDKYLFAILSAVQGDLRDWLTIHGINDYLSLVQTTSKLGVSKAEPEFYKKSLEALAIKPDEVIFVDDSPQYTKLARELGLMVLDYNSQKSFAEQIKPLL